MIGFITKVRSFGGLARYLERGTDGPSNRRVLWTRARYVSNDLREAAAEMNLTGRLTDTEALGYHLTIGYDPADRPTQGEMECAVQRTLRALGLDGNMRITAAHGDAYFAHTHTMVARWDYWTGRLVEASNSYYVITRVMRELEDELGMKPAPRPYYERGSTERHVDERGSARTATDNHGRVPAPGRSRRATQLSGSARAAARAALRTATTWSELKHRLRKEGLRFQRGRDNLLIGEGEVTVRAGRIAGGTSLAKLEARFGQTLREHEADVAGRLMDSIRGLSRVEAGEMRIDTGGEVWSGDGLEREEERAEDLLLDLATALRRREETYELTRRSALLEAEEADVAGLYQDLRRLEVRGTNLLADILQNETSRRGASPSWNESARQGRRVNESRFDGGNRHDRRDRLETEAREIWTAATAGVESKDRGAPSSQDGEERSLDSALLVAVGTGLSGREPAEEGSQSRRLGDGNRPAGWCQLHTLLEEHRLLAGKAWELFGEETWGDRIRVSRGGGTMPETEGRGGASSLSIDSRSQTRGREEGTGREGRTEVPARRSARRLLLETRAAIRGAREEVGGHLSELEEQARDGEGLALLEEKLRRALGRLAEETPAAVSRLAHSLLDGGRADGGREGSAPDDALAPPSVQEVLRRVLPDGPWIEAGIDKRTASRSR